MSENISLAWLWIAANRRTWLNPLAKVMVLLMFGLLSLLPCPFAVTGTPLFISTFILITFCVVVYIILSLNDHKLWLAAFIILQIAGCIVLPLAFYSYCAHGREVVRGIPLSQVQNYKHGSFRLTNGQAVVEYSAILNVGEQNILMAPLVDYRDKWNITQQIHAWAFTQTPPWSDGTNELEEWADPNLHEGTLAGDSGLTLAIEMLVVEYNLKPANKTVSLHWGALNRDLGVLKKTLIIVNVVIYVVYALFLIAWGLDYYRLFWLSRPDSQEDENLYLLKKEKSFYSSSEPY